MITRVNKRLKQLSNKEQIAKQGIDKNIKALNSNPKVQAKIKNTIYNTPLNHDGNNKLKRDDQQVESKINDIMLGHDVDNPRAVFGLRKQYNNYVTSHSHIKAVQDMKRNSKMHLTHKHSFVDQMKNDPLRNVSHNKVEFNYKPDKSNVTKQQKLQKKRQQGLER